MESWSSSSLQSSSMASPQRITAARKHIEEIRRTKFSIGAREMSVETKELVDSAERLAEEIDKDGFSFVQELIQNADENTYAADIIPTLEFKVITKDLTFSGCAQTLFVMCNDVGFSEQDIERVCSIGKSTKKARRHEGFVVQRGIGFKSVLKISSQPYIFSNGYRIRFTETTDYKWPIPVVPEWVDSDLIVEAVEMQFALRKEHIGTIIVLPLRPEKMNFVIGQFGQVRGESLLFLSKLERLVLIHLEPAFPFRFLLFKTVSRKTKYTVTNESHTSSSVVSLSINNGVQLFYCDYYLYRQIFPMKPEFRINGRELMENVVIDMACPLGPRLTEGFPVGIFSQFPSRIITIFPFLVQSDIVQTDPMDIDFDSKWNKEVFNNVPVAFLNAVMTFLNSVQMSKDEAGAHVICWLPANVVSIGRSKEAEAINSIMLAIQHKVKDLAIVPCESLSDGNIHFARPSDVRMILPCFRRILTCLKYDDIHLSPMRPGEKSPLCQPLDIKENRGIMEYLGLDSPESNPDWYDKCIQDCNLVQQLNEDMYAMFLLALASNWSVLRKSAVADTPILKYIAEDNKEKLFSMNTLRNGEVKLCFAVNPREHAWISQWHQKFGFPGNLLFLPNEIQDVITTHRRSNIMCAWLNLEANVSQILVCDYSCILIKYLQEKQNLDSLIQLPLFLHESKVNNFLWESEVFRFCQKMPIVDDCRNVHVDRILTLVPAAGSKWMKLFGFNPFADSKYIALGSFYNQIQGETSDFMSYLCKYTNAVDLPELWPPNVELPCTCSLLTAEQAFILLDWLKCLRKKEDVVLPELFIESIKDGQWMKTITSCASPKHCILSTPYEVSCSITASITSIDKEFYNNRLHLYRDELEFIGVTINCSTNNPQGWSYNRVSLLF
ncbi:sacsin protein [Dioscorea alata]|uniref:Sacsin protein n=1 Tax=Dioscorea alata TaxID=55571 RepID=A0ACB7V989_DIOAL|nr:sacsin protein [Dioscorea alata]